jgi:hypothetical protein
MGAAGDQAMKSAKAARLTQPPSKKRARYDLPSLVPKDVAARSFGSSRMRPLFDDPKWDEEFKKASLKAQEAITEMAETVTRTVKESDGDQQVLDLEGQEVLELEEAVPGTTGGDEEAVEAKPAKTPVEGDIQAPPKSPKWAYRDHRLVVKEQRRAKRQAEEDARRNKQVDVKLELRQATVAQDLAERRIHAKNEDRRENLLMAMTAISFVVFIVLLGIAVANGEKVVFGFSAASGIGSAAGATTLLIRRDKDEKSDSG